MTAAVHRCLLCSDPAEVVGMFFPDSPEAWGARRGGGRFFRYFLCSRCRTLSDGPERVEKAIWSELAGGGVTHAD